MKNIESKLIESRSYKPNKDFSNQSNISSGELTKLNELYNNDPDSFWSGLARDNISWIEDFKTICTGQAPFFKWFKEGKLNVSQNLLISFKLSLHNC